MKIIVEFDDVEQLNCLTETVKWYMGTGNYTENRSVHMSAAAVRFPDGTVSMHKTPTGTIKLFCQTPHTPRKENQ